MKTPAVRGAGAAQPRPAIAAPEDARKKGAFAKMLAEQPDVTAESVFQPPVDRVAPDVETQDEIASTLYEARRRA